MAIFDWNNFTITASFPGEVISAGVYSRIIDGVEQTAYFGHLIATDFGNTLIGGTGADRLEGGAGNDIIMGGSGPTTIAGGGGDDQITGSTGNDVVDAGIGNDIINGNGGLDEINAGAGNDTITGVSTGTIDGGAGVDSIVSAVNISGLMVSNSETLYTGSGTLATSAQLDAFSTIAYSPTALSDRVYITMVDSGGANLFPKLGARAVTFTATSGDDAITAGNGDDVIIGNGGNDILNGGSGNDTIVGGAGNDRLNGGIGNDTITSGGGDDSMTGDAGNDTFIGVQLGIIDGGTGTDAISGSSNISAATISSVEILYTGEGTTATAAQLKAFRTIAFSSDGSLAAANLTLADAGTINLSVQLQSRSAVVHGTIGNDTITTGAGDDTIISNGGNDTLNGNGGNDTLLGGGGDDRLFGGNGNDVLIGGGGLDTLRGGAGNDVLYAPTSGIADGGQGFDELFAQAVDLSTITVTGIETLYTGSGTKLLTSQLNAITTLAFSNSDLTSAATITLANAGNANASVQLGSRAGFVTGSSGNDTITTGAGNDTIFGGNGNDVLVGGAGDDTLTGGSGLDRFTYKALSETQMIATGDIITDFTRGEDRIDLSAIDAIAATLLSNEAFHVTAFGGAGAFTSTSGELRYVASGGNTIIEGDVNGDAVADFHITLNGTYTLTAADFLL